MCGITGIVSRDPLRQESIERLARMNDSMVHRGPDGAGHLEAPHVALSIRRLSIIDLGTGWQPLYNEDHSVAVIANGEIYNYVELRESLLGEGHRFKTASDIETIPHLYETHGDDFVEHLRGMFAIALWDSRRQRLVLARDRMGEKPLFLWQDRDRLIFASEMKTLLCSGQVPFELDPTAVDQFFHYQYVVEPRTPLRGVRKLPAGHLLTVDLAPWSVTERCYWRMEDAPLLEGDPPELIRAELETISEIVIRSDVPVGIALSGGLDSSVLAALAVRKYPGRMHAFSVGYASRPRTDERHDAKALADHLDMPFHEIEIHSSDMTEAFPDIVYHCDDPIADMSAYSYYAISRSAREQGVPVLLQGQGGDELFWGYPWVREALRQSRRKERLNGSWWAAIPDYVRFMRPAPGRVAAIEWALSMAGLRSGWSAYRRDRLTPRERLVFYDLTREFRTTSSCVDDLYAPGFRRSLDDSSPFDLFTFPRPWPSLEVLVTKLISQTYLLENGIAQGDRLSMASSVELRLPLVDYRLVETVIGLRKTYSDSNSPPKAWFREAIRDVIPDWVLSRPKRGFQPPVRAWTRALLERHGELLRDGVLVALGILRPEAAARLSEGPHAWNEGLALSYRALVLETWCRRFQSLVSESADHASAFDAGLTD